MALRKQKTRADLRREERAHASPEARPHGDLVRNKDGHVHLIWLWLIGFLVYFGWNWGVETVFSATLGQLHLHAMNLGYGDILQAPLWATVVLHGYDPLLFVVESLGTVVIFLVLAKLLHNKGDHEGFELPGLGKWLVVGLVAALAGVALCLLTDSLRLAAPLREPKFSLTTLIAAPVCFLSTLAGEVFMMDYLYESARAHLKRLPSMVLLLAVEFIAEGGWHLSWIGMVNVALQVLLCCMLHDRYGLAAPTGLFTGWSFVHTALFVNLSAGAADGVWSVYHVSEIWLTGGSHGLFNGLYMTFFLLAVLLGVHFLHKYRAPGAEAV